MHVELEPFFDNAESKSTCTSFFPRLNMSEQRPPYLDFPVLETADVDDALALAVDDDLPNQVALQLV